MESIDSLNSIDSHRLTSTHIDSHRLTSTHIDSHRLTSTHIDSPSHRLTLLTSTHVDSHRLTSTHIDSHRLTSTHIDSHRLTSTHIGSLDSLDSQRLTVLNLFDSPTHFIRNYSHLFYLSYFIFIFILFWIYSGWNICRLKGHSTHINSNRIVYFPRFFLSYSAERTQTNCFSQPNQI